MKRLLPILLLVFSVGVGAETISHTFPSGNKYVGEVMNGRMHGQGTFAFASGNKYVGEFKDGKPHGQGTLTYANGDKYVGEFKNRKQHGQGTLTWPWGDKYVGEWKNGERHGQGTMTLANGDKYVGEFKDSVAWKGTTYNALGEVIGKWSDAMSEPFCDGNLSSSWGTGFSVNQYHVITNAHVLYCCKKVIVYEFESCSGGEEATVIATEQSSDLGLLRLDKPRKHYATFRSSKDLRLGEKVSTYGRSPEVNGCPQYDVEQGSVTALDWMPDDGRLMRHDARTGKGTSGASVIDINGNTIGVSQGGNRRPAGAAGASVAIKHHLLKAFLRSNIVEYKTASSAEKLSLSEIKEKSDKFTVMIRCIQ